MILVPVTKAAHSGSKLLKGRIDIPGNIEVIQGGKIMAINVAELHLFPGAGAYRGKKIVRPEGAFSIPGMLVDQLPWKVRL